MRLTFDDLFAADPRALATYPLRGKDFYAMTACIEEDGKGADLAVFGPENVRATTKLVFEAERRADEVAIKAPGILPAAGAEVRPALCSAIGFKRNDNAPDAPFGGYPIQAPGRETAMYLGAEATIAQEVKT